MASTTEDSIPASDTTPSAVTIALPTTPIITTPTLLIRPYHASDAPAIAREANDPLIARYMRNRFPHPYGLADAEAWLATAAAAAEGPDVSFAVCHAPSGRYAGGIGLRPFADVEARTMEIGYWLGREHWGRGLATEAVRAFGRWAFAAYPELRRLEAGVFAGNDASARVLAKAGYVLEGRRRDACWKNGAFLDIAMYSLLREECLGAEEAEETATA